MNKMKIETHWECFHDSDNHYYFQFHLAFSTFQVQTGAYNLCGIEIHKL